VGFAKTLAFPACHLDRTCCIQQTPSVDGRPSFSVVSVVTTSTFRFVPMMGAVQSRCFWSKSRARALLWSLNVRRNYNGQFARLGSRGSWLCTKLKGPMCCSNHPSQRWLAQRVKRAIKLSTLSSTLSWIAIIILLHSRKFTVESPPSRPRGLSLGKMQY